MKLCRIQLIFISTWMKIWLKLENHRERYTGEMVKNASTSRSYIVCTHDDKILMRNSKHLRLAKDRIFRPKRTIVPETTSQIAAPKTTGETLRRSVLLDQNHDMAQQVCFDSSIVGRNTEETSQGMGAKPYRTRSGILIQDGPSNH
jgi:hypothetical protein